MAGPAGVLRDIHRLHRRARELEDDLRRGPQAIQARHARATNREDAVREAHETLKRLKVASHDKEVTLRTKMQQIAKHEKQLNESGSKKEYDALQHELAEEKKSCASLENEILDGMEEIETLTARLPELKEAVERAQEEAGQFERESQSRHAGLSDQLSQVHKELEVLEAKLPEEVRPLYDRLTAARGDDALSVVHGRTCEACYTEITHQNYNELLQERFVVCKACGRILYLPE